MSKASDYIANVLKSARYVRMKLADMEPAPYNPRTDLQPEDEEYQRIRASIQDHGLLQPIVYNERTNHVAGGNQRRKILLDGGVEEATCIVIDVPLEQEKRINLALNKIGNMWDQPKLRDLFMHLKDAGYELPKTSFAEDEIEKLTQSMDAAVDSFFEDDDEGEAKEKPVHQYKCPYCGEVFTK